MVKEKEEDVSAEVGYEPAKIPNQIVGKWFPDTPVKSGTRWFYILLLLIMLGYIIAQVVAAIGILFG